ncbi:hypothetical protein SLEP1_g25870 [Rubroshorea leprosula]|uniref:Cytochrome b561 domain-containing protein n=1 Tax=Rubroshorea leprosula TaxID=152421 RepID=A0AAV5JKG5_9ROSI|nr:hypothetical protein SLEP1_g25870 [Rubroshorea leprosula]
MELQIRGVLNTLSWGILMPLGATMASSESAGIQYTSHRNIGTTLFGLAMLQVFALLLRPKLDHKFGVYWNIYHHLVGYTVIILSIISIFNGFDILNPEKKWKNAYIGINVASAFISVLLEAYTWVVVLKRKRSEAARKHLQGVNGASGSSEDHV